VGEEMAIRNSKALGKGINALFQQGDRRTEVSKVPEGVEKNQEFYGSLMKKYVQSGANDTVIAQMLEEIRVHLNISPEDHLQLLNTLKKREEARLDRASKENWVKAHGELKSELGRMFDDYKVQSLSEFPAIEGEEPQNTGEPIALMERNPTVVRDRGSTVISAPPSKAEESIIAFPGHPVQSPTSGPVGASEGIPRKETGAAEPSIAAETPRDTELDLRSLMEDGRFEKALDMALDLLEKDPYSVSLLNEKGVILYNLDKGDEAIQAFSRGLTIEPDSAELNINCAIAMAQTGKLQGSLDLLDKAIAKDPYNEEAWNNRAVILSRIGKLRDALISLDESLRLNDRSPITWTNSAVLLERMGEYGPAFECYGKVLELDPGNDMAAKGREQCQIRIQPNRT
jgi:tetratricopeptide (TPR) repeat protein